MAGTTGWPDCQGGFQHAIRVQLLKTKVKRSRLCWLEKWCVNGNQESKANKGGVTNANLCNKFHPNHIQIWWGWTCGMSAGGTASCHIVTLHLEDLYYNCPVSYASTRELNSHDIQQMELSFLPFWLTTTLNYARALLQFLT